MADFNEIMQGYVNLSYNELLDMARQKFSQLNSALVDFFDGDDDASTKGMLMIIASCLGADGKLSNSEYAFVNDLLDANHSYDAIMGIVRTWGNDEGRELCDQIADSLSSSNKAALLSFCLCFLSVDEKISKEEVAFVRKLLA